MPVPVAGSAVSFGGIELPLPRGISGGQATKLVARTDVRNAPKQGEQVRLRPRADDALLFDPASGERLQG
jgi:hypothetical protein